MKSPSSRDLLLLFKDDLYNEQEIQSAIDQLHQLLYEVETIKTFCTVNEVVDLNKYRFITNPLKLTRILFQRELKPFLFVINKN